MNKKVTGIIVGVTLVAIIGAGGVYIKSQNDYYAVQPPAIVQQEEQQSSKVQLPEQDNSIVENIEIEDDGSVTAIVDGEAFAADPVEEDTRTAEEATYDLGKEIGLSDEEIAEALGKPIPDSRVEEPNTGTPSTSTPENPPAQNNNSSGQQNTQAPDTTPSDGKNNKFDEAGNPLWTGEDPFADAKGGGGVDEIINGDGTVPEEDKGIKFD